MKLLSVLVCSIYNFKFFIYKKPKIINTINIPTFKRNITPNLTLYYPLEMSILSVSIRFMGTILLVIFLFCTSFFLILNFFNISVELVNLIFILNINLLISTAFYHVKNALSHFLNETRVFLLCKKIYLYIIPLCKNSIFI